MVPLASLSAFAALALGMVLTPGPNMIYLLTRSLCQGRAAGVVSLLGVATGFVVYMLAASFGVSALLLAVPHAYRAVQLAGAAYLLYLAWGALKPGGRNVLAVRQDVQAETPLRLFITGLLTNLLNPKIAVLYVSLLPQFIDPARGSVLQQSLLLGTVQILISVSVNLSLVLSAGPLSRGLSGRPVWLVCQRWLMGIALIVLSVRMVV
ncbi:Threonine/homoserine/homoserine lactone efflux protein [Insolitispirillum peregrinum]|uniref:Threonine/homoserine/homoserine lactone efflux protein n=2 Tax=Insolitispirillum peregrinum TaxID=80876 RepID=A0A1N7Q6A1_9PROT|nr:Threonine/homoserine/homoserine lactone efflux protein [Insolitispirillum peregrinum]